MKDNTLTQQQSMEVIREMIQRSKQKFSQYAGSFLVWGWAINVAAAITYVHIIQEWTFNLYFVWIAAIGIPSIWSIYMGYQKGKESTQHAKSPLDSYMLAVWGGSAGVFNILMLVGVVNGWIIMYPLLIAVFGWGVLITGALIKFRPLIFGGISNFFIAGIAVFVATEAILLILIAALTCSYLIPGYMLKYSDK
ncbi:MAG: hypothetical protein LAT67_12390 [Balneolales bacterium]|nr:hypothetical protein [Balneolales bacterium]